MTSASAVELLADSFQGLPLKFRSPALEHCLPDGFRPRGHSLHAFVLPFVPYVILGVWMVHCRHSGGNCRGSSQGASLKADESENCSRRVCEENRYHATPRPGTRSTRQHLQRNPIPSHVHCPEPGCRGRAIAFRCIENWVLGAPLYMHMRGQGGRSHPPPIIIVNEKLIITTTKLWDPEGAPSRTCPLHILHMRGQVSRGPPADNNDSSSSPKLGSLGG
jgi:hypothetical protein